MSVNVSDYTRVYIFILFKYWNFVGLCQPGYTGDLCTFNCSTTQLDDPICAELSCNISVVVGLCN